MYRVVEEVPSVENYINIRLKAGLSRKSEQAASIGLQNGYHSIVIYFKDTPIGLGRIIGDGGCFFEITDIAVLPEHQGNGIGEMIMTTLVTWLKENAPSTAYISLMASHGTPDFYAKYGFTKTELPESAGMFMRIP